MWAGLLDDPFVLAKRFIEDGEDGSADNIEALAISLLCTGVAWPLAQTENSRQVVMPQSMEKAVAEALHDTQSRKKLAQLFTLCAGSGAEEIYQSLFPMLMIDGIDEFVPLLDPIVVNGMLFKQLCDIVDNGAYDQQVKRLVRVLGHCGASVVSRAAELTQAVPGRSIRLRSAAINILGGTNEQSAVAPLLTCLGDKDQFIMNRAINALIRLGPEHSLAPLLQELDNRIPSPARKQIHGAALKIVERFLDEPNPARRLSPIQYQRVINVLMFILTANYAVEVQQVAREILVRQGRTAEKSESGEKAIDLLVQNLSSTEEGIARSALKTLEDIGPAATPRLLELLRSQPPETVRVRIVEVLGYVRDQRALPYLLLQLADPVIAVQQQVALALRAYAPDSISGLIEVVLHGDNEFAAARAEQVLGDIGEDTVRPIISALFPVESERTHLLVHVLERLHDPQAIAPLIALLQTPQAGQTLLLAVIHTLGEFADTQVVPPLLAMLAHSNPLLYEGAINALSHLGEVALDPLIAALGAEETSSITSRVQRAVLGMVHFPGEQLLNTLADAGDKQAEHIIDIFLKKGAEAAQILVANLFHPNRRVQQCVRLMVGEMSGQVIVPPLLDELNRPETSWRAVIAEFLLRHPQEAIPPLVSLLDDPERGDAAEAILLEFGPEILPLLVPGLDSLNNMAQERSQRILVELVRQTPETVHDVVQLFNLSLPQRAHETLVNVLVNDLPVISIPTLLEGLEDAHLVGNVSEVLVRMVQGDGSSGEMALNALLESLRSEQPRHGAAFTLVDIGEKAVPGVARLITDPDVQVAQAAQNVLSEMGVPAFAFIWSAYSDTANPERREAARNIFRNMRTVVIKDELVELLKSNESDKISMALALLLERIHDEALQPDSEHEMIPALLEHVLTHSDEQASLRVLALLLLLGAGMVIDHMAQVLYDYPNHQERLIQAFLLLGEDAEEVLLDMLHDSAAPANLRAEAAGVLGMIAPHPDIREYARMTGEYGLWAGRTGLLQPEQLAIALRGLGGLLAGGHWDIPELQNLRNRSKEGSAERELYDILLGWRYSPRITLLENDLETERQEHKKDILNFTQQLLGMRAQVMELEQELEEVRQEHSNRSEELEQATREIDDLRTNLNQALHEKQVLRNNVQQLTQEKDKLQSRNNQWSTYCDRLEQELEHLRGSDKK
jgi:HEAT repeat protein